MQLPVGGRYVGGYQVVARESITAVEPAQPAAEREPRDPGHGHDSERRRQPVRLCSAVELAQSEPGFGQDCPRLRINPEGFHAGQAKHDGAVAHRVPRDAVAAPAHREREAVFRSDDNPTIQGLIGSGLAYAVLPLLTVVENDPNIAVIPIRPEPRPRRLGIAWHPDRRPPLALLPFVEAAAEICRDLGEQWAASRAA